MPNIERIHNDVLEFLLKKRKTDPTLYFMPRKKNNDGRLDKGYWFRGNDGYAHISLWDGNDWKEKIHNIGFVIIDDKSSFIELSAQDSYDKADFLGKVAKKLGGFQKYESKNKWFRKNTGTDYIKNLNNFIINDKPIIDDLIARNSPSGISFITQDIFDKYTTRVFSIKKSIEEFGKYNKVVRICWNDEGWKYPSGSKGKSISPSSYEHQYGFGHEEWLLDKSKSINGFHYAFLQPLNVKSGLHEGKRYNISLYTINNLNQKYYVGDIKNVLCIPKSESRDAYNIYNERGWVAEMKAQVEKVGGLWESEIAASPEVLFNIKFRFEDAMLLEEMEEISNADINLTTHRFKLLPKKSEISTITIIDDESEDDDEGNKKNTNPRKKVFNSESTYDPYHDKIQNALQDYLKETGEYHIVKIEKDRVDIKAKTISGDWHYYEIKTDKPKLSIRKAIGQIMEYAYYPDKLRAKKLYIIADEQPNENTINYLNFIRSEFSIPVFYKSYDLENDELSEEF